MPNPAFQPVIGSGFDADAAQQQQWSGFNNQVERQNLDSQVAAINAQNQWLAQQQALAEAAKRSDIANNIALGRDQQAQYNFGLSRADELARNNAAYKLQSDKLAAEIAAGKTSDANTAVNSQLQQAETEAQAGIFDAKNYPTLPPERIGFLTRLNALAAKPAADAKALQVQNYFDANQKADELNRLNRITADQAGVTPDTTPVIPGYFDRITNPVMTTAANALGKYTAGIGTTPIQPSDVATTRLAAIRARLAPVAANPTKNGLTIDAATGKVIADPSLSPAWLNRGLPSAVAPTNTINKPTRALAAQYVNQYGKAGAIQKLQADGYDTSGYAD